MNPVLLSVGNIDWTETGRKNLENLSEEFGCDIISIEQNRKVAKIAKLGLRSGQLGGTDA